MQLADNYRHGGEAGFTYRYLGDADYQSNATGVTITTGTRVKDLASGAFYEFVGSAQQAQAITDLNTEVFGRSDLLTPRDLDEAARQDDDQLVLDVLRGSFSGSKLGETNIGSIYLWDQTELVLDETTYVVTHGWNSWVDVTDPNAWQFQMGRALRGLSSTANILLVDWSDLSVTPDYAQAASDTLLVGNRLGTFLAQLGLNADKLHLIGHSLGAHVSGNAAAMYEQLTGEAVAQITAMDPAGPLFEGRGIQGKTEWERLDINDATRVVAIHTSEELGFDDRLGDLDLYLNPARCASTGQRPPG